MADGFVDLQPELAAIQDQVEAAFGALIGRVQRNGLLRHERRMGQEIELVNQLVALELVLAAERIRIGALLDLVALKAEGFKSSSARSAGLIDDAADGRDEDLPATMEDHRSLRERHAGGAAQFFIDGGEQRELFFDAHGEWIDLTGRHPGGFVLRLGRKCDIVFLGEGAGAGDLDSQSGRGFNTGAAQIVGSSESPAAIGEHADSDAYRFVARYLAGL